MIKTIGAFLLCSRLLAAADPIKIESGLVNGVDREGLHAYLGIPYAAPPIDELRWRPPQPVKPSGGVLQANKFGPACVQPPSQMSLGLRDDEISEDCLLVNVWTPVAKNSAPLPVMVWIHGGGFRGWHGRMSGRGLVRQGVILVGIQYRLGYLGFYAHPALTEAHQHEALANYGLMDQIAALKWVKRNIGAFGGDASRVTIFGQSAGCNSVLFLMASPEARGLFAGAICESGNGANPRKLAAMEAAGARDASDLGVGEGAAAITALRRMPAKELLQAIESARATRGEAVTTYPAVDGKIVTGSNSEIFERGEQAAVPMIIGANSYEGSGVGGWSTPELRDEAVRKLYEDEAHGDPQLVAANVAGDGWVVAPARLYARSMTTVKQSAWLYFFSYLPEKIRGTVPGVAHSGELQFISNLSSGSEADRRMAERASAFWVQFAKTGNPNPPGKMEWPIYRADSDQLLELGDEIAVRTHFRKTQLDYVERLWRIGEFRER